RTPTLEIRTSLKARDFASHTPQPQIGRYIIPRNISNNTPSTKQQWEFPYFDSQNTVSGIPL
ncbi:hypothetical protein GIB67_025118, partial [Kingdonia uniflora]